MAALGPAEAVKRGRPVKPFGNLKHSTLNALQGVLQAAEMIILCYDNG